MRLLKNFNVSINYMLLREPQMIVGLKHIAMPGGLAKEILRFFAIVFD